MSHYIERCLACKTVISQCRCPNPNKSQRWSTCKECAKLCKE